MPTGMRKMPNFISYLAALEKEGLTELLIGISLHYIHKYNVFAILLALRRSCISLSLKSSAFSQYKYRFMSLLWIFGNKHRVTCDL